LAKGRAEKRASTDQKGNRLPESGLRFSMFRSIDICVGQQHRVRAKRMRRRAYLQRKKAALRASAARPVPSKQRPKKETEPTE
jgi:hypothetical protein